MKLTYEQLEKSRINWKRIARAATMYLRVIKGGDADRNLMISEIAKLSEWNTKHIEENDKLKLEIAELEQCLTGRTVSCVFCNNSAKDLDSLKSKHQDLQNAVDSIIKLELEFVSCRAKEEWMADWAVAFSNLVKVSGKNNDATI